MQPFSHMQSIDDLRVLHYLTTGYAFLHGAFNDIEKAYQNYFNTSGSPNLKAIGLSKDQTSCLHAAYEGAAKKYGLDWIPQLREAIIGSCPMCGNSTVGTVEHYLPKTPFPEFSVFSWNLVPSCNSCNQKRGSKHVNGVIYQLLHPIFDKAILGKLRLVTYFDTADVITGFELGFNEPAFNAAECSRIRAHINMCVDRRAFKLATKIQISMMAARVASKDIKLWKSIIGDELSIMDAANVSRGWGASCLRGFLELNEQQLISVLKPKILS